jgi:hypothetical protein
VANPDGSWNTTNAFGSRRGPVAVGDGTEETTDGAVLAEVPPHDVPTTESARASSASSDGV